MALGDTIARLSVSLSMDSGSFERGAKKTEGTLGRLKNFLIGPGGIAVAAAAVGAAMVKMGLDTFKTADQIYKASQSIGIGTEELSRLRYAADLSGVSFEQLTKGVGRLSRNMSDAQNGLAAPKRAFDALGISVTNADGKLKSSTEIIQEVAERFSRMEDGAKKTALAMEIFGRAGADLIPMLNQGQEGIAKLTAEAEQFGFVLDDEAGKAAEEFNDNLARLQGASGKLQRELAMKVLPTLVSITDAMVGASKSTSEFGNFFARSMQLVQVNIANTVPGLRMLLGLLQALRGPVATDPIAAGLGTIPLMVNAANNAMRGLIAQTKETGDEFEVLGGAAEKAGKGGGKALKSGLSDELRKAQQEAIELQRLLAQLFPEQEAERQYQEDLARIMAIEDESERDLARMELAKQRSQAEWERRDAQWKMARDAIDGDDPIARVGEAMSYHLDQVAKKLPTVTRQWPLLKEVAKATFDEMSFQLSGLLTGFQKLSDALRNIAARLLDLGFNAAFKSLGGALKIPGYASGTSFASGGLSLVGERGPELVNLPRGSQVIPNHQLGAGRVEIVLRDEMLDARIEGGAGVVLTRAYPAMRADTASYISERRRRG